VRGPRGRGGASSAGVYLARTAAAGHRLDYHDGAAAGAFPISAAASGQAALEIGVERTFAAHKKFTGCQAGGLFAAGVQDGGGAGGASGSDGSFPDPVLTGARVGRPDLAQAGTLLPVLAPIGQEPDAPKQVTNQTRPPPHPSTLPPPHPSTPPTPRSDRRRRLVNATVPHHLLSPTPYRDAMMAGRGRFHRRGQEGRGASAAQPRAAGDRGE
jgi:hypothetical protein